jgi:hypothetical protein
MYWPSEITKNKQPTTQGLCFPAEPRVCQEPDWIRKGPPALLTLLQALDGQLSHRDRRFGHQSVARLEHLTLIHRTKSWLILITVPDYMKSVSWCRLRRARNWFGETLGGWEIGMGREWGGGGQFTSNLGPGWTRIAPRKRRDSK